MPGGPFALGGRYRAAATVRRSLKSDSADPTAHQGAHGRARHEELPEQRHGEVERNGLEPRGHELARGRLLEGERRDQAHHGAHGPAGKGSAQDGDEHLRAALCVEQPPDQACRDPAAHERFEYDDGGHERHDVRERRGKELGSEPARKERLVVELHAVDHDKGHEDREDDALGTGSGHGFPLCPALLGASSRRGRATGLMPSAARCSVPW